MDRVQEVLDFWFTPPISEHWFASTPEIDATIRQRYETLWAQAAAGALDDWRETAKGCLALAIVLDQFPLNMFRGQPMSFSSEARAIEVAIWAAEQDFIAQLPVEQRAFLMMPLMHSESLDDQDESVRLFDEYGLEANLRFAHHHRDIIRRFGRFPHRNVILGRESTPEEIDYLNSKEAFTG